MNDIIFWSIFIVLLSAATGAISAAPWAPTKRKDLQRMLALAEIKPGNKIYDLGCGDGRLVFGAAKLGAKATGYEIFLLPYLFAKIKSFFVPNSTIKFRNFFIQNLADADIIFIFLMSGAYPKLTKKFERELKPGTKIVTYCFPIDAWSKRQIAMSKPTDDDLGVYLYQI